MASEVDGWTTTTEIRNFHDLVSALMNLLSVAEATDHPIGWRGLACAEWRLDSSLDRWIKANIPGDPYVTWLEQEKWFIAEFRRWASGRLGRYEHQFLDHEEGEAIWNILGMGRHAGLPTRILDWTWSPFVAAYFACIDRPNDDGAIWWHNQRQLEETAGQLWDHWRVPAVELDSTNSRALARVAFEPSCAEWICSQFYRIHVPRMEAQQGFMTVCGRLGISHCRAINSLAQHGRGIGRGRIVIPAPAKDEILNGLKYMNVHAKSLEYPIADVGISHLCELARRSPK